MYNYVLYSNCKVSVTDSVQFGYCCYGIWVGSTFYEI